MNGDEVKRRRKALGWTQEELGERVGVVQSAISAFERGGPIGDDVLERIKNVLLAAVGGSGEATSVKNVETKVESTSLERALGTAFDRSRHLLRDANAVLAAAGTTAPTQATESELRDVCALWLDAAAALRAKGEAITAPALLGEVSLMAVRSVPPSVTTHAADDGTTTRPKKTRAA